LCPENIGLDELEWVVLGGWHLFQCGGVYNGVDALQGSPQSIRVSDVPQKEPK
jgi:hypothetical protein